MKKVFASVLSLSILLGSMKVSFAESNNGQTETAQVASQEKKESVAKFNFNESVPIQTPKTTSTAEKNHVDNQVAKQGEFQATNLTVNVNVPGKSSANSAPVQEQPKAPKANNILAVKTYLDDTINEMGTFLEKADHDDIINKIRHIEGEIFALNNYLNNLKPLVQQFPSLQDEIKNVQLNLLTLNYKKDRLTYAKERINKKFGNKVKNWSIAVGTGVLAVASAAVGYYLLHR